MLPSEGFFSNAITSLGISNDDHVVCYDGKGIFSAGRLWWMLRAFGHAKASVLDGGLPKWTQEAREFDSGPPSAPPPASTPFKANLARSRVCTVQKLKCLVEVADGAPIPVVDARALGRFEGTVAEARPNCRSGHIPGSRCVPFTTVLDEGGTTMRPPEEIASVFRAAGVDPADGALIGSCGSGVTASVLALALAHSGREELLEVYDGSWAEWGSDPDLPLETGPASGGG